MTESSIEKSFVRWCRKHKITTFKLVRNPGRGWPDRAVFFPDNQVCWLEFKTDTGELSPAQKVTNELLSKLGHDVYVVRSVKEAKEALARFAKENATSLISADSEEPPTQDD